MSKDRRLGRGLAALLGTSFDDEGPPARGAGQASALPVTAAGPSAAAEAAASSPLTREAPRSSCENHASRPLLADQAGLAAEAAGASKEGAGLLRLPIAEIEENPYQPRRDFSEAEIASLAESLREHDLLQPILVRVVNGRYQLISGERRLRAARQAGWTTIPARVRQADDRLVAELAIVENLQRKDLNPVEKALSFKRYLDEHRCTQDDLARRLKIDRSTIANLMRLLELPSSVLEGLRQGTITAGHARALLPLGDEHEQVALAERIEREGLSVRDVERLVSEQMEQEEAGGLLPVLPGPGKQKRTASDQIASLEQELRHALGTKVEIRASSRGRGKITIHFQSHDEFERLREHLLETTGSLPHTKAA